MKTETAPVVSRVAGRLGRITFSPLRIVAYVLHATGLERIYKPRFMRRTAILDFGDDEARRLPKFCYSLTGGKMDPMNLIFIGTEADLKARFAAAEWGSAAPASPLHLLYGALTLLARRPYRTGPFTPFFVNAGLQDIAFQQLPVRGDVKRRHHLRIWRTGMILPGEKRVWVCAASFDADVRLLLHPPFFQHAIDPDIDRERDYVVRSLEANGALMLKTVPMQAPALASSMITNAYGAKYFTDGRAAVVEV